MNNKQKQNEKGLAAMILVMVLAAVSVSIVITSNLSAISTGIGSLSSSQGTDAFYLTEGCMEDTLQTFWGNSAYTGGTITRPEGQCTVTITPSGADYQIVAIGVTEGYEKTIKALVNRGANLAISNWEER